MLSRVADSLYWMSRYVERAENIARFISVNTLLSLEGGARDEDQQWLPLVETTGDQEYFKETHGEPGRASVMRFLLADPDYGNSLCSCLRAARENARAVREVIPSELWEQLNTFHLMVQDAVSKLDMEADPPTRLLNEVRLQSHLFCGLADNAMARTEAWHFMQLGRMLERADKTSRILDVKYFLLLPSVQQVGSVLDEGQWAAVLRSASAFEAYRRKHGRITPGHVAEFLVLDPEFPRAILHCLTEAERNLRLISGAAPDTYQNQAERRMGRLRTGLLYTSAQEILHRGLHEFLDTLQTQMNEACVGIFNTYFNPEPPGANS